MKLILSFLLVLSFTSTGHTQDSSSEGSSSYDSLFDESQDIPVDDTNPNLNQPPPATTSDLNKAVDPAPLEPVAEPEREKPAPPSKAKAPAKTKAKLADKKAKGKDKAKAHGKDKSKSAKAVKGKAKPKVVAKSKKKKK